MADLAEEAEESEGAEEEEDNYSVHQVSVFSFLFFRSLGNARTASFRTKVFRILLSSLFAVSHRLKEIFWG